MECSLESWLSVGVWEFIGADEVKPFTGAGALGRGVAEAMARGVDGRVDQGSARVGAVNPIHGRQGGVRRGWTQSRRRPDRRVCKGRRRAPVPGGCGSSSAKGLVNGRRARLARR